ncbi:UDP-glucose:glycoprotein glucosyltransferase [Eumeta japonica]|uniref:UDP-glucose:glycoprotein glucosyltransferase n=1 Tax=Eumeta variegata TaxID=151549 RepID=A0A4C1SS33_EUMVA|nr:UDP-glucose:glycoprotein glucosyltransferase [Eumeta japonica]
MHSLTPRIQAHFQIASEALSLGNCADSSIFAQVGNELACTLDELRQKIKLEKAIGGDVKYITRHYLPDKQKSQKRVRLSGYGVELHLKSTEYKSQDDALKPVEDSNEERIEDVDADMEVKVSILSSGSKEFAIDIRDTAILWVNDIENDPQYRRWPSSVMDLLRPTFPDEDSDFDYGRQLALEFVDRLGFADSPQALLNGVPMPQNILASDSDFEEAIFAEIIQQTTALQKAVYKGDLTDSNDLLDYLMNQTHVMPRLNQQILGNNENAKFIDLSGEPHKDINNVQALAKLSNRDMTATLLYNIKYFEGKNSFETIGATKLHFLTIWVLGNVETDEGKELLKNALMYVKAGSSVRIAFIPNTEGANLSKKNNLNRLVWAAQQILNPQQATDLVLKWLKQSSDKWEYQNNQNFYRYVIESEIQFSPNGEFAEGPIAKFTGVPANSLLTQNVQVPENCEFELEYLLLEGHCFDAATGAPPRGLQMTLGTQNDPTMVDTIVMANLGYFQLKANPGVWTLRLREGKSSDIYDITYAGDLILCIKKHADLLGDEDNNHNGGIWNSIASSFGGGSSNDEKAETINIFSLASGHLYERALRIMMLLLPYMAEEYGFQYELVQYKWPRWLHQQTEKQRTIWGYKILFLDVLFP